MGVAGGGASAAEWVRGRIEEKWVTPEQVASLDPAVRGPIAEIQKLGGTVAIDQRSPGKPIVWLVLSGTKVTDVGLEHLKGLTQLQSLNLRGTKVTDAGLVHLKGLTQLRELDLARSRTILPDVTDAGLVHLKGLNQLQTLNLWGTKVSDDGLKHLKGLRQLQMLDLSGTKVSDAGLKHLKGMRQLQTLDLSRTKVTNAGIGKLKKALPNCAISNRVSYYMMPPRHERRSDEHRPCDSLLAAQADCEESPTPYVRHLVRSRRRRWLRGRVRHLRSWSASRRLFRTVPGCSDGRQCGGFRTPAPRDNRPGGGESP
jgi:hypothetical protein